jgi:tryptophan-rich sensory protein
MASWLIAGLICVISAAAEGLLAGSDADRFLQELKQPPWALRKGVELWISFSYYGAAFVTLLRLLDLRQTGEFTLLPLILLMAMMTLNLAWNFVFFRRRDLHLSFLWFAPYSLVVLSLLWCMSRIDVLAACLLLTYALYLPYALLWSYRVWKLNARASS